VSQTTAVNEPAFGPELTSRDIRYAVAIEGKADVTRTRSETDFDPEQTLVAAQLSSFHPFPLLV